MADAADNCPAVANTDQADADNDGRGDACCDDDDGDGVIDVSDNCATLRNPDQADADGDGIGDACDADTDGDGVLNESDLCPGTTAGAGVTTEGCSPIQHIERTCKRENFPNHGRYVSCVAHVANDLVALGLITDTVKSRFVSQAAKK